jgi:hypothetical protein
MQVLVLAVDKAWLDLKSTPLVDEAAELRSSPAPTEPTLLSVLDNLFTSQRLDAWGQVRHRG